MIQHALLGSPAYRWHDQEPDLLLTREMMAVFATVKHAKNFRLVAWIARIEEEVGMRLNPKRYRYPEGIATVIEPEIQPELLSARDAEILRRQRGVREGVYFVTGAPVSASTRRRQINAIEAASRELPLLYPIRPSRCVLLLPIVPRILAICHSEGRD